MSDRKCFFVDRNGYGAEIFAILSPICDTQLNLTKSSLCLFEQIKSYIQITK